MTVFIGGALLGLVTSSCSYFSTENDHDKVVARAGESLLTRDELQMVLQPFASEKDSVVFVQDYIHDWASDQLLLQKAKENIDPASAARYDKMISDYAIELYVSGYLGALKQENKDTIVSNQAIAAYYESNKEIFLLNKSLVKLIFVSLPMGMLIWNW